MERLTIGRWLVFFLAFYMNCIHSAFAYKMPSFCKKEGEPFSFLWRVSNRDPPAFLFGTVHVPYPRVWPHVPPNAKSAFSASTRLLLELDLVSPSTARLLAACQLLPPGRRLEDEVPPALYARLERRLDWVRGRMPEWTAAASSAEYEGYEDERTEMKDGRMPQWTVASSEYRRGKEMDDVHVDRTVKKDGRMTQWTVSSSDDRGNQEVNGAHDERTVKKNEEVDKHEGSDTKKNEGEVKMRELENKQDDNVKKRTRNKDKVDKRRDRKEERGVEGLSEVEQKRQDEVEDKKERNTRERKKENKSKKDEKEKPELKRNNQEGEEVFRALTGDWRRKRPVWVLLLLDSLTEAGVRGRGEPVLDLFLAQEAEREGKGTEAVEEVEEQCGPLNALNDSQVLFALNHTLTQHELSESAPHPPSSSTDSLVRHYNCGDLDSAVFGRDSTGAGPVLTPPLRLPSVNSSSSSQSVDVDAEDEVGDEARDVDEYLRRELVRNRNKRMGSRVVEIMMKYPGESLFFAFGAGHFLGNNSVLDFIQDHGFEIEHLSVYAKIPKSKSKKSIQSDGSNKGETVFSRKGQGRRSSRHRSPIMPALGLRQRLFDTSTPATTTTHRAKSFNDLWIRLGGNEKKSKIEIHSMGEHHGPHQTFQKWYQENHRPNNIPLSAGAALLNSTQFLFIITIICIYFSAFHIDMSAIVLTGIT